MFLKIENRSVEIEGKRNKAGLPVFEDRPYWYLVKNGGQELAGEATEEWRKAKMAMATDGDPEKRAFADAVRRAWEAYEAGKEVRPVGMPLSESPLFTRAEVDSLRAAGFYTVEEVTADGGTITEKLGNFGAEARDRAKNYMKAAQDTGKLAGELDDLKKQNESLKQDVKDKDEEIGILKALNEKLTTDLAEANKPKK